MNHRTLIVRCRTRIVASNAAPQERPMHSAYWSAQINTAPDVVLASDAFVSSVWCTFSSSIHFQFNFFVNIFNSQTILGKICCYLVLSLTSKSSYPSIPPLIVRPKEKTKVLTTNPNVTQHLWHLELTVLNLVDHPLKTKTISIDKGHDHHIAHDLHYHDLTLYHLCKMHVSHDN
jgi:hypothetical protein